MKKTIIRLICLIFALVMLCSVLTSCTVTGEEISEDLIRRYYCLTSFLKIDRIIYNEKRIIGKTVEEITEMCGDYDYRIYRYARDEHGNWIFDENGDIVKTDKIFAIQYITHIEHPGFMDKVWERYTEIHFDEDGKAYEVLHDQYPKGG